MQISKHFLVACSLAVATGPVCLRADDIDAQTTARAALHQKMQELNGQAPAAVTQPENTPPAGKIKETTPPETQAPPMQKPAPHPVLVPAPHRASPGQPPVLPPVYMPTPMDTPRVPVSVQPSLPGILVAPELVAPEASSPDLIEQARQATRAKLAEMESQRNDTAPVKPRATRQPVSKPARVTAAPTTTATPPPLAETKSAQPSKEEIRAGKQREAAQMKAAREQAEMEKAAAKKAAAEKAAAEKAAANEAKTAAQDQKKAKLEAPAPLAPLAAPDSSLPATKQQRLETLLDQYKADKLTAQEYHDERAKIIAEP